MGPLGLGLSEIFEFIDPDRRDKLMYPNFPLDQENFPQYRNRFGITVPLTPTCLDQNASSYTIPRSLSNDAQFIDHIPRTPQRLALTPTPQTFHHPLPPHSRQEECHTSSNPRKQNEICLLFLRKRCPWGRLCHRIHPKQDTYSPIQWNQESSEANIPSQPPQFQPMDGGDGNSRGPEFPLPYKNEVPWILTDTNTSTEVCRLFTRNRCYYKPCRFFHPRRIPQHTDAPQSSVELEDPARDAPGRTECKPHMRIVGNQSEMIELPVTGEVLNLEDKNHVQSLISLSLSFEPLDSTPAQIVVKLPATKARPRHGRKKSNVKASGVPLEKMPEHFLSTSQDTSKGSTTEKVEPMMYTVKLPPSHLRPEIAAHVEPPNPKFTRGWDYGSQPNAHTDSTNKKASHTWDPGTYSWDYDYELNSWADCRSSDSGTAISSDCTSETLVSQTHDGVSEKRLEPLNIKYPETCGYWLRGFCPRGDDCRWQHYAQADDFSRRKNERRVYEENSQYARLYGAAHCEPRYQTSPHLCVTIDNHAKVKFGEGFSVVDVMTGFESRWVIIGNVPPNTTAADVHRVVELFGNVVDIKVPRSVSAAPMTVKACFSSPTEAAEAAANLDGADALQSTISVRLAIGNSLRANGRLNDTSVRVQWESPSCVGFAGYPNSIDADVAMSAADGAILRGYCVSASYYQGLPTIGEINIRFRNLPPDVTVEELEKFGETEGVMLEKPNYGSLKYATMRIQKMLEDHGELQDFDVLPPPFRYGIVTAWAHFASPLSAKSAAATLSGQRFKFIGKERLWLKHVHTISYTLPRFIFDKVAADVTTLRGSSWKYGWYTSVTVIDRSRVDPSIPVFVKLSGENAQQLGSLKSAMERVLRGETVTEDGKIAWDEFFVSRDGIAYILELHTRHPRVSIQTSIQRRTVTLFGSQHDRERARRDILRKLDILRRQKYHTIPIPGRAIGIFMSSDLIKMQQEIGCENVVLNLLQQSLKVRGNSAVIEQAHEAIKRAQRQLPKERQVGVEDCPVCLESAVAPVTLECGHFWCRSCLANFLIASAESTRFPLTCLGNEGKCAKPISLAVAQSILSEQDFNAVAHASFTAYVHSRPDEFHYCPTPNCPQVYRGSRQATVLQCPECLLRICSHCHIESHDDLPCVDYVGHDDKLFKEWAEGHGVKNCPGCKAPIERTEGCNHMTCIRCQTHICWVCMETFPRGEGIYDHMRAIHGGIGL